MAYVNLKNPLVCHNHYLSEEHVKTIIKNCFVREDVVMENFTIRKASDNMLGFLADYWKLQIQLIFNNKDRRTLRYFIKAISTTNVAKAKMVKEMGLFDKELFFYSVIKRHLDIPGKHFYYYSTIIIFFMRDGRHSIRWNGQVNN